MNTTPLLLTVNGEILAETIGLRELSRISGFSEDNLSMFIAAGHLPALAQKYLAPNSPRRFATRKTLALVSDEKWLEKAMRLAISRNKLHNARKKRKSECMLPFKSVEPNQDDLGMESG